MIGAGDKWKHRLFPNRKNAVHIKCLCTTCVWMSCACSRCRNENVIHSKLLVFWRRRTECNEKHFSFFFFREKKSKQKRRWKRNCEKNETMSSSTEIHFLCDFIHVSVAGSAANADCMHAAMCNVCTISSTSALPFGVHISNITVLFFLFFFVSLFRTFPSPAHSCMVDVCVRVLCVRGISIPLFCSTTFHIFPACFLFCLLLFPVFIFMQLFHETTLHFHSRILQPPRPIAPVRAACVCRQRVRARFPYPCVFACILILIVHTFHQCADQQLRCERMCALKLATSEKNKKKIAARSQIAALALPFHT